MSNLAEPPFGMKITQELLDRLTEEAKASPRLRVNYDLRNSAEDGSQRMLNAIEPGSVLSIHRHRKTSETVVCLRGKLVVEYYEEQERTCTEVIELSPNGRIMAYGALSREWHRDLGDEGWPLRAAGGRGCAWVGR